MVNISMLARMLEIRPILLKKELERRIWGQGTSFDFCEKLKKGGYS